MPDDLSPRMDRLERLQAQHETLTALLITSTTRLEQHQLLDAAQRLRHSAMLDTHADEMARLTALAERQQQLQADLHGMMAGLLQRQDDQTARLERHAERMAALEGIAAQHEEHMRELRTILAAIKDMLERGNGH